MLARRDLIVASYEAKGESGLFDRPCASNYFISSASLSFTARPKYRSLGLRMQVVGPERVREKVSLSSGTWRRCPW